MKGAMIKGNLRLEALCNFRKCSVSDIIFFIMNSKAKILGVRKIGNR
jgi:DNA-binding Xre family transcriptional regulator